MSRFFAALSVLIVGFAFFPAYSIRAEDGSAELDRRLAIKYAELQIQQLETRLKYNKSSPEALAADELLRACQEMIEKQRVSVKEGLKRKLAEIDAQVQEFKQIKNGDMVNLQFLEQARAAINKKLLEIDVGPLQFTDNGPAGMNKKQDAQNSKLHVKLANGGELDAEGPWLQQMPEVRDMLEQFTDAAKDGAVTFRVPEQFDVEAIKEQIRKVAPKVTVEFAEKLRLVTAVSDDAAQLRRAAGIFKMLRPGNPFDQKFKGGEFNPGMRPDGEMKKFNPGQPPEEMKKKKDTVDDKF